MVHSWATFVMLASLLSLNLSFGWWVFKSIKHSTKHQLDTLLSSEGFLIMQPCYLDRVTDPQPINTKRIYGELASQSVTGRTNLLSFGENKVEGTIRGHNFSLWETPNTILRSSYMQCIDDDGGSVEIKGAMLKQKLAVPSNETNGYLLVTANGGLNQMRTGICDMVAVARLMNATLVIPFLDHMSFWDDSSEFGDIFYLEHFISSLKDHVHIIKSLPNAFHNATILKRPTSRSNASYYEDEMLGVLKQYKVLHFTHANSRLANNGLPSSIQHLRCRANYKALQFTEPIREVASKIVKIMRSDGPYVALHLRYEMDMLAFTGCTHHLLPEEAMHLKELRYKVKHWKVKEINAENERSKGACPLTPHETALLLRGLGLPPSTKLYIVAGKIYGKGSMENLRKHYPNIFTHSSLTSVRDDLQPLLSYKNRLAGVDYMVALASDMFIYTYDGNMAKAVQGHRFFEGYGMTVNPDRKNFIKLMDAFDHGLMTWNEFRLGVVKLHANRTGNVLHPRHQQEPEFFPSLETNFYANPYPDCICKKT